MNTNMNVTNYSVWRKLKACGFWFTFFSGHWNLTKYVTLFGENAMHWSLNIYNTKWGHIHIDLPTWSRLTGKRTWCMFASPNGTPWAATWYIGTTNHRDGTRARIRRQVLGHNFKVNDDETYAKMRALNENIDGVLYGPY